MLITTQLIQQIDLPMPLRAAHAALADVEATGKALPDVHSVTRIGPGLYAWDLLPRKAFGTTFTGSYVTRYLVGDNSISWDTVSGNMLSKGSFRLAEHAAGVTVAVDMIQEMDLPFPELAAAAAQFVIRQKIARGIAAVFALVGASAQPLPLQDTLR